jgi:hypothetical protein
MFVWMNECLKYNNNTKNKIKKKKVLAKNVGKKIIVIFNLIIGKSFE